MNTIIKLFRRYFLAQFIIDLLNKKRDIGIKGNRQRVNRQITMANEDTLERQKKN